MTDRPFGAIRVDEVILPVVGMYLAGGEVHVVGLLHGPVPARSGIPLLFGSDGLLILRGFSRIDLPAVEDPDGSLTVDLPLSIANKQAIAAGRT